jgi:hypothetical protein
MRRTKSAVLLFFLALVTMPAIVSAQTESRRSSSQRDTTVTAGFRYRASGLHELFFGSEYRDLWTSPIDVPILDMQNVAGGLTPTTAGGGFQTKSLRFRGNNGLLYGFRSVDKDPDVLPPGLEGTVIERLVQDQISSAHPVGPAIAAPLMEAAGILHTEPILLVLPDNAALGEFRERFAGTLGFFEARVTTEHATPFAGALEIIDSDELFNRIQAGADNRVDTRELLTARMFDLLIGDWDRHRGQWNWARFDEASVTRWVPIPEDRDQAFVRFDGLLLSMARTTTPQLVNFGDSYPDMLGLTWNGRELDRRFLVELDADVWDAVVSELQARLTDAVIDSAVAQMPLAFRRIDGMRLAHALKRRRDLLGEAAERFYELLAREVAVHGTDASELVTVDRNADGSVAMALLPVSGGSENNPFFQRTFLPDETSEIRVYLHGGDDRVVVGGDGSGTTLRFIGGAGNDVLIDSSSAGGIRLYTDDGDRSDGPSRVKVDRRTFVLPPKEKPTDLPPRDWGHMYRGVPWGGYGPDVGLFLGGGVHRIGYGFRHIPFASRVQVRTGYSTAGQTGRFDLSVQLHRSNSRVRAQLDARASGIEVLRFYGLGNETVLSGPNDNEYYRVKQIQYSVSPTLVMPVSTHVELSTGPTFWYSSTINQSGRFLATLPELYGAGKFGQVGWQAQAKIDSRDVPAAASRGVRLDLGGSLFPALWDVDSKYGEIHGVASTYFSATNAPLNPTLAVRAGGRKVWGHYPFQSAAYIGDASSVRLGRQNRYGGDASAYANAELRFKLSRIVLVLPGDVGLFALGDIGRTFLEGEESDRWHNALGGGVWISFLGPANTLSIAVARSEVGTSIEHQTSVYIQGGFAF